MPTNNGIPQELRFSVYGSEFAAQAWGDPTNLPVLALHGWLDNSASFFALAPRLANVYLVALDLAGHGFSAHRPGIAAYNIWEDIAEVFAVADQLGWKKFALLGHSRGAIIATLAAGTFPDRITHVGLIEGLLPEPMRIEDTPQQLALSIKSLHAYQGRQRTLYPDMPSAITARANGMFPLSYTAAEAITHRGVIAVEKGLQWNTDPRLLAPSAIKLLSEQSIAFVNRIQAPIKLIVANEGMPKRYPHFVSAVKKFPQVSTVFLEGGHHLHMEQEVDAVAAVFNPFFV